MFAQTTNAAAPRGASEVRPNGRKLPALRRWKGRLGLALTEVLVGIAIITLVAATGMWALGAANRLATVNRNFTGSKTLLQNQIDSVLCVPYTANSIPPLLNTGSSSTLVTVNPGPPAITGTMTTNIISTDPTLNLLEVTVTVAYPYQGKIYSLSMATARSPD
jgi:type II secretory pathway pseudopilin PulG